MLYILGAAMLVAAILVLHLGRAALDGLAGSSDTKKSRVADLFAIAFTGLFGTGFILLAEQTMVRFDFSHIAGLVAAVVATIVGARYAGRYADRRTARAPL